MKKNNLKIVYTLCFLYFVCCILNASQKNEKSIRVRAIAWKHSNNYTEKSFAFCTKQEKEYQIQKEQEKKEFKALFKASKPIPFKNKNIKPIQKTPYLHKIFKKNNTQIITKLLQEPINIHRIDNNGDTLVHIACKNNNVEIIKLLYPYFNNTTFLIRNTQGFTPIHIVCMHNYIELLQIFFNENRHYELDFAINLKNIAGLTPLNLACIQKNTDIVKLLLKWDININTGDIDNSTPLHHAVENGTIDIITLLLHQKRINLNIRDIVKTYSEKVFNNTPLHIACYKNNTEVVKLLLQNQYIHPNINNADLLIPLKIAMSNNNNEIITLLSNHPNDFCEYQ